MNDEEMRRYPGGRLRLALSQDPLSLIGLPTAYDGLMLKAMGQDFGYVSGAMHSAALGDQDIGVVPQQHFIEVARDIGTRADLDMVSDLDAFSNPDVAYQYVTRAINWGLAGGHIEDQVMPKRCGQLEGKTCMPIDEFVQIIEAAAQARDDASNGTFVVIARTDIFSAVNRRDPNRGSAAEVVERIAASFEAGADVGFLEGLPTREAFAAAAEALVSYRKQGKYLLANMTEFGSLGDVVITADEFAEMGYHITLFPVSIQRAQHHVGEQVMKAILQAGSVETMLPQMQTRADRQGILSYEATVATGN